MMSTFDGFMSEIAHISIDRFCANNLKSRVFFLSHCHEDHMVGLHDAAYLPNGLPGPLYASPISVVFLKHQFPKLKENLVEMRIGHSTLIQMPNIDEGNSKEQFLVTALPAGHCPGSVMFLFETNEKKILYTGDFRLSTSSYKKMNALHYESSIPKQFDNIYLDTTFLDSAYTYFPSQFESFEEIYKESKKWLNANENNILLLVLPAKYGSEFVFIELAKRLKMPIHVSQELFERYKYISEMDDAITLDPLQTKIHACEYNSSCKIYHQSKKIYRRYIRPTALYWKNLKKGDTIKEHTHNETIRICYSSHASYDELKHFIEYFKPKSITPCVLPQHKKQEMTSLIEELMKMVPNKENIFELPKDDISKDVFVLKNEIQEKNSKIQIVKNIYSKKHAYDSDLWSMSDL